jgi:cell division protein FtsB
MEQNSGGERNSGDFLTIKRLAYGFLALAVINTVANFFLSDLNVYRVTKLKQASIRLESLIEAERKRNENLKAVSERIKKNPTFYKEKFVREYLLMFRKGEKVIPLPRDLWYQ